ncbi:MAG: peptide MFS transporter [Polyangiaceae bacterium]
MSATAEASSEALAVPSAEDGDTKSNHRTSHPAGLYFLFATEMWERFSYYGMRALLVLYLVQHHGFQPSESSTVYKYYTSLVYLAPLIGGFLADRFFGLRASIFAGAILMAIGHFLMAFEPLPMFYTALAFLIAGNGFFKPNISTLVGKMYGKGDPRRDGAFTIFYMGINMGAWFAPLVCGEWLRKHHGFHYGFGAAGVGMVIGLALFAIGQPWIKKAVTEVGNDMGVAKKEPESSGKTHAAKEPDEALPGETGVAGMVTKILPAFLVLLGTAVVLLNLKALFGGGASVKDSILPIAFAGIAVWMGVTLLTIKGPPRDKSTVIFVLFMFVVLFWMAFEQAGNALNLWAQFFTDRHVGDSFEYSAESFQSVNAFFIVAIAPIYAAMWLWLNRAGKEPSTPAKMTMALVLMGSAMFVMGLGAARENMVETKIAAGDTVPKGMDLGKMVDGRIQYDATTKEITARGVVPEYAVHALLREAASKDYVTSVDDLAKASDAAKPDHPVVGILKDAPADFVLPFDAKQKADFGAEYDPASKTLKVVHTLDAPAKLALVDAGAPAPWKATVTSLSAKSQAARIGGGWLILFYLLATLGELCLSPVGLSMVTKLAPARFASLFMGVWLLASSVAQYVGGSIGESWGKITPTDYFSIFVKTLAVGAVLLFALVVPLRKLMHKAS